MPRPRSLSVENLTPGQAVWVLKRLVAERRINAGDVNRYVGDMQREIDELQRQLDMLRAASGRSAAMPAPAVRRRRGRAAKSAAAPAAPAKRGRKARPKRTPEQEQSMKLQGRYLGLIRQIPGNKRAQFQKIAKEKGREAAINALNEALKRK